MDNKVTAMLVRFLLDAGEFSGCYNEILNPADEVEVLDEIRRWLDHRGF